MRYIPVILLLVTLFFHSHAALSIKEIRTASNKVLVVFMKSTTVKIDEPDVTPSRWKINDAEPVSISRFAMSADQCDHHVYLETSELIEGNEYQIRTPYGDTTIQFDARSVFCESIKTNQAAYSALATNNYALFAIWLGDAGGKAIEGSLPEYEVFEQFTGTTVASGTFEEIGRNDTSDDYVYRIDLSEVPEGGPYKIAVKGFGCSYPFGIGGDFSRRLAYVTFRGQYYQRCGCPIHPPYGMDIRKKACHSTVYKVNGEIGEANIEVEGSEPSFSCYGGYHDAGDADRRAFHMSNPVINLMVYEAFPDLFTDEQFNIPDKFDEEYNIIGKGNGIPDIIDEAVWGTLVWEYLQNDDGSIQFGTETKGYPEPFAQPMDLDAKKYGTVKSDNRAAAVGAGLFMHLARIIRPYDEAYSDELAQRGKKSYAFIEGNMANPEKLYYNIQKYLFDGDESAHVQVKNLKNAVDNFERSPFGTYGYSLNDETFDNPGYIISYIIEKQRETDSEVVQHFTDILKKAADTNLAELEYHAFPVGNNPDSHAWGHNVMQPQYACAPLLYWRLSEDQTYLDGACNLMNYTLGLNPIGICYVTGLGMHQIHNPHDRESAYTVQQGWGPKPGITVFGPGVISDIGVVGDGLQTYPEIGALPFERKFGDDMASISTAEFTIFETMSHNALYTVLANGGTWDESKNPYEDPNTKKHRPDVNNKSSTSFTASRINLSDNTLTITTVLPSASPLQLQGELMLLNGKRIARFSSTLHPQDNGTVKIPLQTSLTHLLSKGVSICRIKTAEGITCSVNVVNSLHEQ